MKWAVIAVAVVAALVVAVAVVGALTPRKHVASRSARFGQTPATLYRTITAFGDAPSWRKDLKSVELLPDRDGKRCFRELSSSGPMTLVVEVADEPRKLVTRIADDELPFGGSWTFRIEDAPGGARLTITENGEIDSVVFRAIARLFIGYEATLDGYLKALGAKFGEAVEVEPGSPDPDPFG